ncbi:MAG: tripartite tricarboxylate transporter TctB family protein [Alphaproteobacteria bacterium]|jgi:putative tricarboxylic transport membrane protein
MSEQKSNRFLRPETLTAVGLFLAAAAFLVPTAQLPQISALLPAAMLISLLVLAMILLIADQRKAAAENTSEPVLKAPPRVFGAFLLILLYALAVNFVGFYVSTAVSLPLVAFVFGYRNLAGLGIATIIVVAAIYLIFSLAMAKEFPSGILGIL